MARIGIRWEAFENGDFPMVCCKTGRPADVILRQAYRYTPTWTYILIFFGFVPFLIASLFASVRFDGALPWSHVAEQRVRTAGRLAVGTLVLGVLSFISGFAVGASAVPLIAGFGFLIVSIVAMTVRTVGLPGAIPDDHRAVELTRVHPRFVEAVRGHLPSGS